MSLRLRVLAGLVVIALAIVVGAFTLTATTRSRLEAQVDSQLNSAAELVSTFDFGDNPTGRGGPGAPPQDAIHQLSTLYLGYLDNDGSLQTLYAPDFTEAESALPNIDTHLAREEAADNGTYTVSSTSGGVRFRVHALRTGNGRVVLVALPLNTVDDAVASLVTIELVVSAISGVVLVLVGWWVIRLGVRPLKSMASTASAIAAGDLSSRVPAGNSRTEAGELGLALNTMLGRIEAAFDARAESQARLQRFVADASHELRTPVATIRGYAELYRQGGLATEHALADAMRRTEQEAKRMGLLVDDMLLLAKLDERRPLAHEAVDIAALAMDAVSDAQAVDPSRAIVAAVEPGVVVDGDVDRLRQVIANLIANALVHTPAGSPIEVCASHTAGDVEIAIVDHGP
ncbi:MAG TPA: histidine kinase dimerization/phospho-acceptor domain-containing protein, partial [Ilumatobacteraceae bacterium]